MSCTTLHQLVTNRPRTSGELYSFPQRNQMVNNIAPKLNEHSTSLGRSLQRKTLGTWVLSKCPGNCGLWWNFSVNWDFAEKPCELGCSVFQIHCIHILYFFLHFFSLGICWVLLLLLLWLNVGFFLFVLFCAVLQTNGVCLLLLGVASSDDDESDCSSSSGVWCVPIPSSE